MNINKKIVILDLKKDIDYLIEDCDILKVYRGFLKTNNVNCIDIGHIKEKDLKIYKKKLLSKLSKYSKNISKKCDDIDANLLEIFNLRNDKIKFFDKFFYILHLKKFLEKNKYREITIINDDPNYNEIYNSLKFNKINFIFLNKKKKYNFSLFYFLRINFFFFKTLFLLIYIKLFLTKQNQNKIKTSKEAGLTIFPQYFISKKNKFYRKNHLNINFLLTDETHLGNTFYQNISSANKINLLKNTIFVEKYLTIADLFKSYFLAIKKLSSFKNIFKKKIIIDGINIEFAIDNLLIMSLINFSKLKIYNNPLKKILNKYNFKKFHYYMFEYNFGFYLNSMFKKINPKIKMIGYQHGIYSDELMWMSLIDKEYLPTSVISKYIQSKTSYQKIFSSVKLSKIKNNKNTVLINKLKSTNIKNNKILVFLGLHDSKDMIYSLIDNKDKFSDKKIIMKMHPKSKKFSINNLPKNFNFEDKLNSSYRLILVSTTSTMVYDFINNNTPFKILIPNYMNPLTSKKISIKYNNI